MFSSATNTRSSNSGDNGDDEDDGYGDLSSFPYLIAIYCCSLLFITISLIVLFILLFIDLFVLNTTFVLIGPHQTKEEEQRW